KDRVHAWTGAEAIDREAAAVLFDNGTNTAHEVALNLTTGKVTAHTPRTGVQPTMTIDEQIECEQAVLASPLFKAALKKHYGLDGPLVGEGELRGGGFYGPGGGPPPPARPAALLRSCGRDGQRLRPAHRGHPPRGGSQQDGSDPHRGIRPVAAAAAGLQLRRG